MKTKVEKHFDKVAKSYDFYKMKNEFYYKNIQKLLSSLIPRNKSVFEVGCGTGDLLVSLNPKIAYGMDISDQMIKLAKSKYKK
jgi:ubiquinone/menaquinone biosynthesis C-methylase UbiE